jgi:hypothetical protein
MTDMSAAPNEGLPWMPEEDLLVLAEGLPEGGLPPAAIEAFEAIQWLRASAIQVVVAHESGGAIGDAIAELEQALLAGVLAD